MKLAGRWVAVGALTACLTLIRAAMRATEHARQLAAG